MNDHEHPVHTGPDLLDMLDATPKPLPTLPGKVHGIVSLDPPTVQCDGCLKTYSDPHLGLAVLTSGIQFNAKAAAKGDRRRLCRQCAREAGWDE